MTNNKKRRPLNKQNIVFYRDSIKKGREYIETIHIGNVCERDNCPNEEEHLTFDGQIFFRRNYDKQ